MLFPPPSPASTGSPGWEVAPTLLPLVLPDLPARTVALAKLSLAGAWARLDTAHPKVKRRRHPSLARPPMPPFLPRLFNRCLHLLTHLNCFERTNSTSP